MGSILKRRYHMDDEEDIEDENKEAVEEALKELRT